MTRILLVQTASPKRICAKAEQILASGIHTDPELVILCNDRDSHRFRQLQRTTVYPLSSPTLRNTTKELQRQPFDLAFYFWTGEKKYRRWKLMALRLGIRTTYIISGDGNEFRLTWKALCRHAVFRLRHPLPTDHYEQLDEVKADPALLQADMPREKVLVVQSAEPPYVLQALANLAAKPQFANPALTIFCRNKPEVVGSFRNHPMLKTIVTHSETRDSLRHLFGFRRQRYDAVVVFLTGDPSYWKVKLFAFLLGARRILVFNEEADCFFFNLHQWLALLSHRIRVRPYPGATSKWGHSSRILVSLMLKSVILPFRFLWLVLVWIRLRSSGFKGLRESHDGS